MSSHKHGQDSDPDQALKKIKTEKEEEENNKQEVIINGLRFDKFYSNPLYDIILRSQDGLHFMASSFDLKREAEHFRDSIDILKPQTAGIVTPLEHLDTAFPSSAVRIFLDQCHARIPSIFLYDDRSYPLQQYRKMIDKYVCPNLLKLEEIALEEFGNAKALELLALVGESENVDLAKVAIIKMSKRNELHWRKGLTNNDVQRFREITRDLPLNWHYPIMNIMLDHDGNLSWPLAGHAKESRPL